MKDKLKGGEYVFYCGYDGSGSMAPGIVLEVYKKSGNAEVYWIIQQHKSVVPLKFLTDREDKTTNV